MTEPNIDEIANALGEKPRRRTHDYWKPFAWAIRSLVERGFGVTEATREILKRGGVDVTAENVNTARVVYYKIRKQVWPESLKHLRGVQGAKPKESPGGKKEDFEV